MTLVAQKAELGDFIDAGDNSTPGESGYPIGFQGLLEDMHREIAGITEGLEVGALTPMEWNGMMRANISRGAQAAFMIGNNFAFEIDPEHLKSVKAWVGGQLRYLDEFTNTMTNAAGEFNPAWYNRAKMYANATYTQYWEGATVGLPLPAQPAQGTQCLANCKCRWDIKWIDKEAGDADCYWVMAAAEHCQTCQVRAASWNPVKIRGGNLEGLELPPEAPKPPPAPKPAPKSQFGEMKPVKGRPKTLETGTTRNQANFHFNNPKWKDLSDADQKDQICKEISKRTGLPYNNVNTAIHQWAQTSNDTSYASMELQRAAAKLNGTKLSEFQEECWNRVKGHTDPGVFEHYSFDPGSFNEIRLDLAVKVAGYDTSEKACEAFLKAMYDYTQEEFRAAGVTELHLFRGVTDLSRSQVEALVPYKVNFETIPFTSNVMESWSMSNTVAFGFGHGGVVFEVVVPIERIIGSCRTGFGCVNEVEYVMLGNVPGDEVSIYKLWKFWEVGSPLI